MEWVRSYVLTLTAAGILCAVVRSLAGRAGKGRGFSMACGAFLILAALGPLKWLPVPSAGENLNDLEYEIAQSQGRTLEAVRDRLDAVIKEKTCTYIQDKGRALGTELEVEVTLKREDGYSVPETVEISGAYSPYIKAKLSHMLEEELGIPERAQRWA